MLTICSAGNVLSFLPSLPPTLRNPIHLIHSLSHSTNISYVSTKCQTVQRQKYRGDQENQGPLKSLSSLAMALYTTNNVIQYLQRRDTERLPWQKITGESYLEGEVNGHSWRVIQAENWNYERLVGRSLPGQKTASLHVSFRDAFSHHQPALSGPWSWKQFFLESLSSPSVALLWQVSFSASD